MSDPIHPHWQATDSDRPVPVRVVLKAQPHEARFQTPPRNRVISRKPAAVAGIALALFAGYGLTQWQGANTLPKTRSFDASVANVAVTVRITETGIEPKTILVSSGDKIAWTNKTSNAVLLTSPDLCDDYGCLEIALESGETYSDYTISNAINAGTYQYGSPVDPVLTARIHVQSDKPFAAQTTFTDLLLNGVETGNPFEAPPSPFGAQAVNPAPRTLSPSIPRNTNTAVPGQITAPAPQTSSVSSRAAVIPENAHTGAPALGKGTGKPGQQPETGAGMIALTGVLSAMGILYATRRMFAMTK